MIGDKIQNQEGGENSSNIQGQIVNIINNGISYSEVKEIVLELFEINFLRLKNDAAEIVERRVKEITEGFLTKLFEDFPEAILELKQPALQDALFNVQKEYAKSGDIELGNLLVDILIIRINSPKRNLLQIILDEALRIAPKLTIEQLDIITINFLLTQAVRIRKDINTLEDFIHYIKSEIVPFVDNLTVDPCSFEYIRYVGCGQALSNNYGGLSTFIMHSHGDFFYKGFTKEEFEQKVGQFDKFERILIPCNQDKNKFQINYTNNDVLMSTPLFIERRINLDTLYISGIMKPEEVKTFLISIDSKMQKLYDAWQTNGFQYLSLTSIGIVIANANYQRKTGKSMDLTVWIS